MIYLCLTAGVHLRARRLGGTAARGGKFVHGWTKAARAQHRVLPYRAGARLSDALRFKF
jgi:hypothetical protein